MLLTRPRSPKPPTTSRSGRGPLSSRGGTLLIAALLSLVAGAALLVFLRQYREDIKGSDGTRVLVSASLLPKGTRGEVVLDQRMYRIARIRDDDVKGDAITDPSELQGRVAKEDLFPGHQLTTGDFEDADSTVGSRLTEYQRAITVPVDRAHGMVGKISPGDRVDVVTTSDAGAGVLTVASVAARGALVLAVPDDGGSNSSSRQQPVTLRVTDRAAVVIASAADGGKVWLFLRPAVGAQDHNIDGTATGAANSDTRPLNADVNISVRQR